VVSQINSHAHKVTSAPKNQLFPLRRLQLQVAVFVRFNIIVLRVLVSHKCAKTDRFKTKRVKLNVLYVIQVTLVSLVLKHYALPSMFVIIQKLKHIPMENFVWVELMQLRNKLDFNHTITAHRVHQPSSALPVELFLNVPLAIFA